MDNLKAFLEKKYHQYGGRIFIENDPITIPHRFAQKKNIEIAGFLTATIAWGQRKTIIRNASLLMEWMDNAPGDFMKNSHKRDLQTFKRFVHRTFQGEDCYFFIDRLRQLHQQDLSLERIFSEGYQRFGTMAGAMNYFRKEFFDVPHGCTN